MADIASYAGFSAAALTSLSYLPQVRKAWVTRQTEDISWTMLLVLVGGLTLWIVYGVLRSDAVIIIANSVSVTLIAAMIVLKARGSGQAA